MTKDIMRLRNDAFKRSRYSFCGNVVVAAGTIVFVRQSNINILRALASITGERVKHRSTLLLV